MKTFLEPDLIPRSSFYKNLRSILKQSEWDIIRKGVYAKAGNRCEICLGSGRMEAHEIWEYNEVTRVQKLVGFSCLCSACHEVKHFGLARVRGRDGAAMAHMIKVNGISRYQAEGIIEEAFSMWQRRSGIKWTLDILELDNLKKGIRK